MKKIYKYIFIITLMMFGFVGEVRANDELNGCVDAGTCELLCTYKSDEGNAYIYKYIRGSEEVLYFSSFNWNKDQKKGYVFNDGNYFEADGKYHITSGAESWNSTAFIDEELIKNSDIFSCPQYIYKNNIGGKEVCFDNDDYCKDVGINKFKKAMLNVEVITEKNQNIGDVKLSAEKAKEKVHKYFNDLGDKSDILELCVFNNNNSVGGSADQIFIVTTKDSFRYFSYYNVSGYNSFREIRSGIDNSTGISWGVSIKYNDWGGSCIGISKVFENQSSPFGTAIIDISDKKSLSMVTTSNEYSSDGNPYESLNDDIVEEPVTPQKCEDLLGNDLREEINSYLLYIKIAVPIIIIVMGSLDFGKAFISSDEDSMKKAQKKFIMRLIIGMVIFFLPALVNILLNIANQVWGFSKGTCGITF